MNKKIQISKDNLVELYITKNLSPSEIENDLNISHSSFCKYIKQFGIVKSKDLIVECRRRTNLEKYGSETYNNMKKNQETKILNHGDPYYKMVKYIRDNIQIIKTLKIKLIIEYGELEVKNIYGKLCTAKFIIQDKSTKYKRLYIWKNKNTL